VRNLLASDQHVLAFVPSAVIKVSPTLVPLEGGTHVHIFASGLACDEPSAFGTLSLDDTLMKEELMGDDRTERLKVLQVRLVCQKPECDVIVRARCIGKNRLVIHSPDLSLSPIAPRAHHGPVPLAVQVSMDGGLSWTEDAGVKLTYLEYPLAIAGVDPECAPASGNTRLQIHTPGLKFPGIPTETLTVAFKCRPKARPPPPADPAKPSPLEEDISGAYVEVKRTQTGWYADRGGTEYPPVGDLNIYAYGTYDYRKEVIEVYSPPFDVDTFMYYDVSVDASLDGKRYFGTPVKFQVYDLKVARLSPSCGPLGATTRVQPVAEGLVRSRILRCRADYPEEITPELAGGPRRDLPGTYDSTTHRIAITMPSLEEEVKQRVDLMTEALPPPVERFPEDEGDAAMEQELAPPAVDPDGGLNGLRVPVELTLNGQNYTDDCAEFVYYGHLEPGLALLSTGGGAIPDPVGEEPVPVGTELLFPVQNLPGQLDAQEAVVVFKVVSPTAADPANPTPEEFAFKETVPAALIYRGQDGVLVLNSPGILSTRVSAEAPPEKLSAHCELSLNGQHFLPVPGALTLQTRPPDPVPE
jgi:hypothetical protein